MRRRTVLAATAGVFGTLSACVSSNGSDRPAYEGLPEAQSPDERFESSDVQRTVRLAAVDAVPDGVGVSIDADLIHGRVTGEGTARIRVTTINEGPERFLSVGEEGCSLFNRNGGESEDRALWLVQPGFPGMTFLGEGPKRVDPLWAIRTEGEGSETGIAFLGYLCRPRRYGPGEALATEYRVWDGWRGPGYMPAGRHRFEETVEVRGVRRPDDADGPVPGDRLASFDWGLELVVGDPGG